MNKFKPQDFVAAGLVALVIWDNVTNDLGWKTDIVIAIAACLSAGLCAFATEWFIRNRTKK